MPQSLHNRSRAPATLRLAGLSLATREEDGRTMYVVSAMPDASPEQLAVRHGWLTGTVAK